MLSSTEDEPNLLRAARESAALTQQELAAAAQVSVRTVNNLECYRIASPRLATLRQLASALGVSGAEVPLFVSRIRRHYDRRAREPIRGTGERPPL